MRRRPAPGLDPPEPFEVGRIDNCERRRLSRPPPQSVPEKPQRKRLVCPPPLRGEADTSPTQQTDALPMKGTPLDCARRQLPRPPPQPEQFERKRLVCPLPQHNESEAEADAQASEASLMHMTSPLKDEVPETCLISSMPGHLGAPTAEELPVSLWECRRLHHTCPPGSFRTFFVEYCRTDRQFEWAMTFASHRCPSVVLGTGARIFCMPRRLVAILKHIREHGARFQSGFEEDHRSEAELSIRHVTYDEDSVLMVERIMLDFNFKVMKRKRWSVVSLECA